MPKYTATYTEYHHVAVVFSDEFDTSDSEKWEWLRSAAQEHLEPDEFEQLPEEPPTDPKLWFELYGHVAETEYSDNEEDWITVRKGGYETSRELHDMSGNVVDLD